MSQFTADCTATRVLRSFAKESSPASKTIRDHTIFRLAGGDLTVPLCVFWSKVGPVLVDCAAAWIVFWAIKCHGLSGPFFSIPLRCRLG